MLAALAAADRARARAPAPRKTGRDRSLPFATERKVKNTELKDNPSYRDHCRTSRSCERGDVRAGATQLRQPIACSGEIGGAGGPGSGNRPAETMPLPARRVLRSSETACYIHQHHKCPRRRKAVAVNRIGCRVHCSRTGDLPGRRDRRHRESPPPRADCKLARVLRPLVVCPRLRRISIQYCRPGEHGLLRVAPARRRLAAHLFRSQRRLPPALRR